MYLSVLVLMQMKCVSLLSTHHICNSQCTVAMGTELFAQFFCFIPMATWYHFVVMLSANIDGGSSKICQALSGLEDTEMKKKDKVCLYA